MRSEKELQFVRRAAGQGLRLDGRELLEARRLKVREMTVAGALSAVELEIFAENWMSEATLKTQLVGKSEQGLEVKVHCLQTQGVQCEVRRLEILFCRIFEERLKAFARKEFSSQRQGLKWFIDCTVLSWSSAQSFGPCLSALLQGLLAKVRLPQLSACVNALTNEETVEVGQEWQEVNLCGEGVHFIAVLEGRLLRDPDGLEAEAASSLVCRYGQGQHCMLKGVIRADQLSRCLQQTFAQ